MSIIRERVINEHIKKNYPNSRIINYDDPDCDFEFFSADELKSVDKDWFPLCCYKDKNGKAVYGGRSGVYHTYTEGETGAGKTTRFVMQSIFALSSLKVKPSFVIVDIHGEIIENLYLHLKKNGYDIKILNCDDPQRSDTYNPFSELAGECLQTHTLNNDAINKIRKISEIIQPVESTGDPIWDRGARSYTNGCILDKFEDLIKYDIPAECLTLYNILQNHYWLRNELGDKNGITNLMSIPHYRKKGAMAISMQKMLSVTNNAEKTRSGYYGVIENHYDTFGQPSLYSLSSSNTIDISDFIDNPTVIVIQSGSTKIGDDLISLLLNEIYTYVVKKGKEQRSKRLSRNIHCFLDEFANCNIADGPEYIKMLTTSRKFGMFWHMILQCDAQLDRKYDAKIGKIIRANSTEIFMGSLDYDTEVRFAKSCGQKTIESLSSVISQKDPRLEIVDLMTADVLNLTDPGYIYIKSGRHPLTKTFIEAFYNCSEFIPVEDISTIYPVNDFDYHTTSFFPDDIPPELSFAEYEMLEYVYDRKRTLDELRERFAGKNADDIIKCLARKGLINLMDEKKITSMVESRQFMLYRERNKYGLNNYIDAEIQVRLMSVRRRPFSLYDDDDDQLDFEERSGSYDMETIENWLADEKEENRILADLLECIDKSNAGQILSELDKLTFIPEFLSDVIRNVSEPDDDQYNAEDAFPENADIFKCGIVEEYIKNNNFSTKKAWVTGIQKEYAMLAEMDVFPDSVMEQFKNAVDEIKNDMSLADILQIKTLVSE